VVIEAEELVADPAGVVRDYCHRVGIEFIPSALTWSPGDRPEWSRTRQWHAQAARTGAFVRTDSAYPVGVHNSPLLGEFYRYHVPFYTTLREVRGGNRFEHPPEAAAMLRDEEGVS
jgi:hypothetical protein